MRRAISHVAVIIPARNEEALIARCLESVAVAIAEVRSRRVTVSVTVVADDCTDDTVTIARSFEGVRVLGVEAAGVGTTRSIAAAYAIGRAEVDPSTIWIANTDADSVVPPQWLTEQLRLAGRGVDLMIGTVRPDFADLSPAQIDAWLRSHPEGHANGHVHGANLGLRAQLYIDAGGYPPLAEHEDVDLVARCAALNPTTVATAACEVLTSGRPYGRTDGGYARYLRSDLVTTETQSKGQSHDDLDH